MELELHDFTEQKQRERHFPKKITEEMDGFPGDILATIIYTLNNNNKVTIAYSALGGKSTRSSTQRCTFISIRAIDQI